MSRKCVFAIISVIIKITAYVKYFSINTHIKKENKQGKLGKSL